MGPAVPLSPTCLGSLTRSAQAGLVRKDSSPRSRQDIPSPLKIHGKPGEEVSPAAVVPESGGTVSLSMAGFPGRWLGILCVLVSLTPSAVLSGAEPGEHDACCQGAPPPRPRAPKKRAEVSDVDGARHAWHCCWKSVARLLLGDVSFHFPSSRLLQAG